MTDFGHAMLKTIVGFVIFAALALFIIFKGGSSMNLSSKQQAVDALPAAIEAASAGSSSTP